MKRKDVNYSHKNKSSQRKNRSDQISPISPSLFKIPKSQTILIILVLFCTIIIAYMPAIKGGFIWDDDAYVSNNPTMLSFKGLLQNWKGTNVYYQYYPLVLTSFWIEYRLWGLNPIGYHITNVLIHSLNALLLFIILRGLKIKGALLASVIFALHPVCVESVAWITERKNILSLFFYLLSALSFFGFYGSSITDKNVENKLPKKPDKTSSSKHNSYFYILSLLFFVLALLSKTVTSTLPAALLLIIYWKRGRIEKRDVFLMIPFFIIGIAMGLFTTWVEKHIILAKGEEWSLTFMERCIVAGRALCFYASKLVLPLKLTFIYPRWHISQTIWLQYIYPFLALLVMVILWLFRNRLGRGTLISVLFFAGTLFPALGFFNLYPMRYSFVADHFQYHASIGLIVLGASVLYQLGERREQSRLFPTIFFIFLIFLLGFQTYRQTHIYKDLETLWTDTIRKNPTGWMAYTNLSLLRKSQGRMDEALKLAQKVLELRPNDPIAKHNVANILLDNGQIGEAIQILRDVVVQKPDLAPAHSLLGTALIELSQYDEAEKHLRIAIKLSPNYINPHESLARLFFAQGQFEECIQECYEVLIRDPKNAQIWLLAGDALETLGRKNNAIAAYQKALEAQPNLLEAKERLKKLQGN